MTDVEYDLSVITIPPNIQTRDTEGPENPAFTRRRF